MTKENNYILLLKKEYENLFSDCLKGKVPTNIRLDTEALTNLLALENVAQIEASIRKGCISATHFISSDGKYIYDIGINDMENQLRIEDFRALYPETWWTIDCVIES